MIIGILGDTQFTTHQPERRLDNYWLTQQSKFNEALEIFNNKKCDAVIQPGDLVDSPNVSNVVMSTIIDLLKRRHQKLDVVWGNHDVSGISVDTLPTSPLSVLKSAGVINLLNSEPYIPQILHQTGNIAMYGAGFGEEVPTPKNKTDYNILIIHAMIGNRQLFPNQELENPKRFLKQNPGYNLIICGHYHYRFIETFEGRAILNAGALVRESISEFDMNHKPGIVIFDTDTNKAEVIELTFEPVEKVFDLTPAIKRDNTLLNKFIERLKTGSKSATSGWKQVLTNVMKEKHTSEGGKLVIDNCLMEIYNK